MADRSKGATGSRRRPPTGPGNGAKPASDDPVADAGPEFSLAGQLLVATNVLTDPPFAQAVIVLCAHSASEGAMGIIVNKAANSPDFADLLNQLGVGPTPPLRRLELCAGGPCETSRGFVLHTTDWQGDGSLTIDDSMSLTASLDVLKAIATGQGPSRAILALGHAAWSPGQLEREMEENVWLTIEPTAPIVFDPEHSTKWRRALGQLRIDPLLLSGRAGHA